MTSSGPPAGPGDVVELTIGPVAHGGHCVARHEGRVVFVRHTLPGERVRARLTDAGADARFWRADATEVIEASSDRVEPRCPVSGPGGCGGCDWQHADVPAQRRLKAAVVAEQLHRLAGLQIDAEDVTVERVPTPGPAGSEQGPDGPGDGLGWRTRVRLAVAPDGRAGLRAHRSHAVIALVDCPIAHRGLGLPEILSRRWPDDAEIVVAGGDGQPPTVQSVRGSVTELESGPSRRREVAAGRAWRVSGAGFWQVHPGAADALVEAVRQALQPTTGDSLLDLYSGVGLFAGALAGSLGESGRAVAVESDTNAVRDARRNLHDAEHVRLEHQRVDHYLRSPDAPRAVDVVVLDPPRSGAGRQVCRAIAGRRPRSIAYVACDPAALARDVATFAEEGYVMTRLRAFDLFPMTHHVECVATLQRRDVQGRMVAHDVVEAYSSEIS